MTSLIIDAFEGRTVGTADVRAAYLNAIMPDFVTMQIRGEMINIMLEAAPSLATGLVTTKMGEQVLIVVLHKALYGCVQSAMLWYNLFTDKLQHMGFELNKIDPCVANKTVNGKQCTIAWFVDDC